jgi:hypothetical protein
MENQKEQLSLFTQEDFEPKDIKQAELTKVRTNLQESEVTACYTRNDCAYYIGTGNCSLHGDTVDCWDCDDYESIDDDDTEDDN